jgi:hypothetical protein
MELLEQIGPSWYTVQRLVERVKALEAKIAGGKSEEPRLREVVAEKLRRGGMLSREEVAFHLDVSTKKVQRLEAQGRLLRCADLGTVVRYRASDVLRLASAK